MNYYGIFEVGSIPVVVFNFGTAGLTGLKAEMSYEGEAFIKSANSDYIKEVGNGYYSLKLTATETKKVGLVFLRFSKDGYPDVSLIIQIRNMVDEVARNTNKSVRNLSSSMDKKFSDLDARTTGLVRDQMGTSLAEIARRLKGVK